MGVTQTLLRNILVGLSALSFSATWLHSKLQKKDAASIPNAVGKGKSYPSNNKKFAYPAIYPYFGQQLYQILYEVRNHQGAQKSARSKGGPIARGMSKCPFQISKSRNFSGIVPNSGVFRSRIYR